MIVSLDDLPEDEDGDVDSVRPNKSADAPGNFAVSPGGLTIHLYSLVVSLAALSCRLSGCAGVDSQRSG